MRTPCVVQWIVDIGSGIGEGHLVDGVTQELGGSDDRVGSLCHEDMIAVCVSGFCHTLGLTRPTQVGWLFDSGQLREMVQTHGAGGGDVQ